MNANLNSVLHRGPSIFGNLNRILNSTNGALLKFHLVASQCSSFIREDVFDLAQFFHQAGGAANGWRIHFIIVHVKIIIDEDGMIVLYDFDCNEQGYGYQGRKENPICDHVEEELLRWGHVAIIGIAKLVASCRTKDQITG